MNRRQCLACGQSFVPHPSVRKQQYCSAAPCQRARRRRTQAARMADDPAYRENQARAAKRWRHDNQGYWRTYRENHPEYVQRNRELQRERNARSRRKASVSEPIANMNELAPEKSIPSGRYRLKCLAGDGIANMNELIVTIEIIQDGCAASRPAPEAIFTDCKDWTSSPPAVKAGIRGP